MTSFENIKQNLLTVLIKYPVSKAAIYGSYSRNEQSEQSDVDLLIELSAQISIFDILRMENELSLKTQKKVDIVEYSAIKPSIKERVLSQAIQIL